ncbi:MAG: excisionase family DNA-binding protein [Eggerthellaceae bacterium]|nr:excisionase family DNA-binding protein [Eggerthellaceae bacterium]
MEELIGYPPEHIHEGRILTLKEAAERLCTSYSTTYRLVIDGELRAFRLRNAWRTSEAACDAFLRRHFAEQEMICQSTERK